MCWLMSLDKSVICWASNGLSVPSSLNWSTSFRSNKHQQSTAEKTPIATSPSLLPARSGGLFSHQWQLCLYSTILLLLFYLLKSNFPANCKLYKSHTFQYNLTHTGNLNFVCAVWLSCIQLRLWWRLVKIFIPLPPPPPQHLCCLPSAGLGSLQMLLLKFTSACFVYLFFMIKMTASHWYMYTAVSYQNSLQVNPRQAHACAVWVLILSPCTVFVSSGLSPEKITVLQQQHYSHDDNKWQKVPNNIYHLYPLLYVYSSNSNRAGSGASQCSDIHKGHRQDICPCLNACNITVWQSYKVMYNDTVHNAAFTGKQTIHLTFIFHSSGQHFNN